MAGQPTFPLKIALKRHKNCIIVMIDFTNWEKELLGELYQSIKDWTPSPFNKAEIKNKKVNYCVSFYSPCGMFRWSNHDYCVFHSNTELRLFYKQPIQLQDNNGIVIEKDFIWELCPITAPLCFTQIPMKISDMWSRRRKIARIWRKSSIWGNLPLDNDFKIA